nr:hypothetical protein [uncultured Rhodopila sp.]
MFLTLQRDPDDPGGGTRLRTGIHFDTSSLLEWSGWTSPARLYLSTAGENLDIHQFVEDYLVRVNGFHAWLETALENHHRDDLQQLAELQARFSAEEQRLPADQPIVEKEELGHQAKFPEFPPDRAEEINETASALLQKIREVVFKASPPDEFPTQREISATLMDRDMVKTPVFRGIDVNGERVVTFIARDQKYFGLYDDDYRSLDNLSAAIFAIPWTRDKLSRMFIENEFFAWAQGRFQTDGVTFTDALQTRATKAVRAVEIWAPVAHLEIQETFDFGPVKLCPITSDKIDEFANMGAEISPDQRESAAAFFEKLRADVQGFAAVVVPVEAEPILAEERGKIIARDVVSLLRFFSPAAGVSGVLCPTALMGAALVPTTKILMLSEASFSMSEAMTASHVAFWRLSACQLEQLKANGLRQAGRLVLTDGLSDFAATVRSSPSFLLDFYITH